MRRNGKLFKSVVQSIIMKRPFYKKQTAINWVRRHKFKVPKEIYTTSTSFRFRQVPPQRFEKLKTLKITKNISFVIELK